MTPNHGMTRRAALGTATAIAAGGALAARQDSQRPDAIFIGAGINALGAAFLLGKAGWRVLVLERNSEPGGCVRTLELTRPGFRHDIGPMNLTVFANSPF